MSSGEHSESEEEVKRYIVGSVSMQESVIGSLSCKEICTRNIQLYL